MKRFGTKLRALRKSHGMTLVQLTHAMGYSNNGYISLIETGKVTPRVDFVIKVADLFRVSTDRLIRDELEIDGETVKPYSCDGPTD
jgi:transcriptional regulator with XRE-family HTH domain